MRILTIAAAALLAACGGAGPQAEAPPAEAAGAPVQTPPRNAPFEPAFAGQTRAPEMLSGVALAVEERATGLSHAWAIAFLPDGRALVTERPGRMRVIGADGAVSAPLAGLPAVEARSQGGLLDVSLSPSFATDRLVYWSFSEPRDGGRNSTSVARGRLSADATRIENARVIFRQQPAWDSGGHFGSRLVWRADGTLFVTMGDRQRADARPLAQDLSATVGKIARINADGSPAADNPFAGQAGARPEIWSYGHRNVQGAVIHPDTGKLWAIEHGPRGGDELNVVEAGVNYGWPIISYGIDYNGQMIAEVSQREGMAQPVYYWDPVIAPGGMLFYAGDLFPWRGDLIISALRPAGLVRLELDGERVIGEERLLGDVGRIRDVAEAADGALWVVTDEDDARVLRVTPRASQ